MARKRVRTRKDGYVEIKRKIGTDLSGNAVRKSFYGKTRTEAVQKAEAYKTQKLLEEKNLTLRELTVTFREYAAYYLENTKKGIVKGNTYKNTYFYAIKNHLVPYFGNFRLQDIKKAHIQKFIQEKADYSESYLQKFRSILYGIFELAVDENIISKNPARNIQLPKKDIIKPEKRAYSQEQADLLYQFAIQHPKGASIAFILKTGVRRGELLALTWKDFDAKNGIVSINKALYIDSNNRLKIGLPKSKSSIRIIPIDTELSDYLKSLPKKSDLMFPNSNGEVNNPNNWSKRLYKPFMADFNKEYPDVPILNPHELRHTYGTLLYQKGVDIYTIQKVMGHESIEITTSIYIHNNNVEVLKKNLGILP